MHVLSFTTFLAIYDTLILVFFSEALGYSLVDGVKILPIEVLHEFHDERVF